LDILDEFLLGVVLDLGHHLETLAVESDQFAAKAKTGATAWYILPLGHVWGVSLGAVLRFGEDKLFLWTGNFSHLLATPWVHLENIGRPSG
jgi:hypothetical protein